MARQTLTVQEIDRTGGLNPTYDAAHADGHKFANDSATFLHVKNAGASPVNVTVQTGATVDGLAVADLVVAIPAGDDIFIGPFPARQYDQASAAEVWVDFAATADMSLAALKLS